MGFAKILSRDAILGKKTVFGIGMAENRNFHEKKEQECGIGTPLTDPVICGTQPARDINDVHNDWWTTPPRKRPLLF